MNKQLEDLREAYEERVWKRNSEREAKETKSFS